MKQLDKTIIDELTMVLKHHAERYPQMMPNDAVKLIFQNEFGGGHLISDKSVALNYLIKELEDCRGRDIAQSDVVTDIGNGIVRLDIVAVEKGFITAKRLIEIFAESAKAVKGDSESFYLKIELLEKLTEQGVFGFSKQSLAKFMKEYNEFGKVRALSHSEHYRGFYAPAYRIVLKKLLLNKEKIWE